MAWVKFADDKERLDHSAELEPDERVMLEQKVLARDRRIKQLSEEKRRVRQLLVRGYAHIARADADLAAEIRKELWGDCPERAPASPQVPA